ncbi:winged helix-turn-helix domain-containing protein [Nostoc commune]|uniref:winged helix-turn-helix domain-containing protein n=1 Tax=Nostoc commune TaxID=1178 RepID=UPI003969C6BC
MADLLSELTGKGITRHRRWEYLQQMTYRLRVPRPEHGMSDSFEQKNWKKTEFEAEISSSSISKR